MKKYKIISVLALLIIFSVLNLNAQENTSKDRFYCRSGISQTTGMFGVEYMIKDFGVCFGWKPFFTPGLSKAANVFNLGTNYYFNGNFEKKNSFYVGLAYSNKSAVKTTKEKTEDRSKHFNLRNSSVNIAKRKAERWCGGFNVVGGYKVSWNVLDIKLGISYKINPLRNYFSIDCSIGASLQSL